MNPPRSIIPHLVRIWSFEYNQFWAQGEVGYTPAFYTAGRFTVPRATEIVERANGGGEVNEAIYPWADPPTVPFLNLLEQLVRAEMDTARLDWLLRNLGKQAFVEIGVTIREEGVTRFDLDRAKEARP